MKKHNHIAELSKFCGYHRVLLIKLKNPLFSIEIPLQFFLFDDQRKLFYFRTSHIRTGRYTQYESHESLQRHTTLCR